jgi:membrane-bound ClpP family serine protease
MLIVLVFLLLAALLIALRSHVHKRFSDPGSPISSLATVHTRLSPAGSVFVAGELWLARSIDGNVIPERTQVWVVGLRDQFLLVTQSPQSQ